MCCLEDQGLDEKEKEEEDNVSMESVVISRIGEVIVNKSCGLTNQKPLSPWETKGFPLIP